MADQLITVARKIADKWGGKFGESCTSADCGWNLWVDSHNLPEWWRGQRETFGAAFHVSNGIVDSRSIGYCIGVGPGSVPSIDVSERQVWREALDYYFRGKPFLVETQSTEAIPHYRAFVSLKPDVPNELRGKYLSVNLNCLWQIHGCKDAGELLPAVEWQ